VFLKISLGIITVAALLFIGTCVVVIAALHKATSSGVAGQAGDKPIILQVTGAPGATCSVERLEAVGLTLTGATTTCTVPGTIVLAGAHTYIGSRLTATVRQTSAAALTLKVTGCGGNLTKGATKHIDDTATVGCD
jgi:hypothetical protein